MQVGQTYSSASQGMSHHDWYTFLVVASWLDGAGRVGPAVNLASNWNATAPKPVGVQTTQPSSTIGRTITLSNGRVVNVQTGGGRIIQGNLQSPNVPRLAKVNGKWTQARPIGPNAQNHLRNSEGFTQRVGVSGGHDQNQFFGELRRQGINPNDVIIRRTPHPTIRGIVQIEYRIPAQDIRGNIVPGQFKSEPFPVKTIYDPNMISHMQMFNWGVQAMQKGVVNGRFIEGFSPNGLKFIGYLDMNGAIKNFHPVLE